MTLSEKLTYLRFNLNAYHYNCILNTLAISVAKDKTFTKEAKKGIQNIINYMDTEHSNTTFVEIIKLPYNKIKISNLNKTTYILIQALKHGIIFTEKKMDTYEITGKFNYYNYQLNHNNMLKTVLNKIDNIPCDTLHRIH